LGLPTIIDIDDVDTSIYETRLSAPGTKWWERLIINHHLRQLRQIIPTCIQAAGHVWVASPEDLDVVQHPSKSVLPNIPFGEFNSGVSHLASPSEARPCVLMVGSLTHIVNCRAIDRFLETVWPAVIHEVPQAVFRIVGSGMTPERSARWAAHPQVEAVGFVENLAAEYARCAFAVCPIFEGGGTKIKVLESLAYGRTIAVTRHSMRGYERELVNGESLLIADNEGQLAQACVRLLRDPPLCVRLADAGAGIVSQHFSFERFSDEVRRSVLSVIDREARRGTTGHRDQYFAEHGEK
jgi:glycosyltransferase involved in cell wall biosynthesis